MANKKQRCYNFEDSTVNIRDTDIYRAFVYFIICAFLGWIFETAAVFIRTGTLTHRGLLFIGNNLKHYLPFLEGYIGDLPLVWGLPVISIYGSGGVIIIYGFSRWKDKPIQLFFVSMFLMTIFELLASYWCQYVLHQAYWNYSKSVLNYQGRICLRSSIAWGVLSVLAVRYIAPKMERLYYNIKRTTHFKVITILIMIYLVICMFVKYPIGLSY